MQWICVCNIEKGTGILCLYETELVLRPLSSFSFFFFFSFFLFSFFPFSHRSNSLFFGNHSSPSLPNSVPTENPNSISPTHPVTQKGVLEICSHLAILFFFFHTEKKHQGVPQSKCTRCWIFIWGKRGKKRKKKETRW